MAMLCSINAMLAPVFTLHTHTHTHTWAIFSVSDIDSMCASLLVGVPYGLLNFTVIELLLNLFIHD